jgi:hypothetical protein
MCQNLGLPTPTWALPERKGTEISVVRNYALHEALYFQEPLGFAAASQRKDVSLEMHALTSRLLAALLGKQDAEYVTSPVNTRMIFPLDPLEARLREPAQVAWQNVSMSMHEMIVAFGQGNS